MCVLQVHVWVLQVHVWMLQVHVRVASVCSVDRLLVTWFCRWFVVGEQLDQLVQYVNQLRVDLDAKASTATVKNKASMVDVQHYIEYLTSGWPCLCYPS